LPPTGPYIDLYVFVRQIVIDLTTFPEILDCALDLILRHLEVRRMKFFDPAAASVSAVKIVGLAHQRTVKGKLRDGGN